MTLREFARVGHWPSLLAAFLYFQVSFMVWVLLGALATAIDHDLHLSALEKGILVAVPLLGGSLLRLLLGLTTDLFGARTTAVGGLLATLVPLGLGWLWADSFSQLLLVGLLLGVAGASFAAALPMASCWYPPESQGLALGIVGAGNSGTALALFFAPRLANALSWQSAFGLALIPVVAVLVLVLACARENPNRAPPKTLRQYASFLRHPDARWLAAFYSVTFGGFVGLTSFLGIYFRDQFQMDPVSAGTWATFCALAGSLARPLGGYLADQWGGMRVLLMVYAAAGALGLGLSVTPPVGLAALFMVLIMLVLGGGSGAVFQIVPQRFSEEIGVLTGVIGAAGGLGGFLLSTILGGVKQWTASFGLGFLGLSVVCLGCASAIAVGVLAAVRVTPELPLDG